MTSWRISSGWFRATLMLPNILAISLAVNRPSSWWCSAAGILPVQTAAAIAEPMADPIREKRARSAMTVARSCSERSNESHSVEASSRAQCRKEARRTACGTEACEATREPTTEKAPPSAMRICVQTSAASLTSQESCKELLFVEGRARKADARRVPSPRVERQSEAGRADAQPCDLQVLVVARVALNEAGKEAKDAEADGLFEVGEYGRQRSARCLVVGGTSVPAVDASGAGPCAQHQAHAP